MVVNIDDEELSKALQSLLLRSIIEVRT